MTDNKKSVRVVPEEKRFQLATDLMELSEGTRKRILILSSMLNRAEDDSYYIPRRLCDAIKGAVDKRTFDGNDFPLIATKKKKEALYNNAELEAKESVDVGFENCFSKIFDAVSHDSSVIDKDILGKLRDLILYDEAEKISYAYGASNYFGNEKKTDKDEVGYNPSTGDLRSVCYENIENTFLTTGGMGKYLRNKSIENQFDKESDKTKGINNSYNNLEFYHIFEDKRRGRK